MNVLNNTLICFYFFLKCSQNFSVCMEPVAYLGGALGHAPFHIGHILENLVFLSLCASTSAQRKCAPFWNPKYAIAWSPAPDPAGKRIVLHRFRSSYIWVLSWKGENRWGTVVLIARENLYLDYLVLWYTWYFGPKRPQHSWNEIKTKIDTAGAYY